MGDFDRHATAGRGLKRFLSGSVAGLCLAIVAGPGLAQTTANPTTASPTAFGSASSVPVGAIDGSGVEPSPQIVIGAPGTPTTALDPDDITGVGQMVIDQGNGFVGLCTGTLINPRTVIFAAHCVNDRAAGDYGAASGGTPIGFGFNASNHAPGDSALLGWLFGGHQSDPSAYMFNANHVAYNPASLDPAANGFLFGDVAIASFDTVATNVPTWALLFSALPATPITAGGTGYHVALSGYGNNGTGANGSYGATDFRRRVAENMLGALASIGDFESFLFGVPGGLPQNLYWIDFDDPRRGTAQASPFDFNAWRDNAVPNEGITAQGDSGGPLILDDTFSMPVVIGVLSGGYTRFFGGQPANGYGTASFYQPLYLYWDWIAANNPYHYVSALAGDGNWTDASHWVSELDPNYQIIGPDGQLVNGLPTTPGEGPNGTEGAFGQACFESGGLSECLDMATGASTFEFKPIGTGGSSGPAVVSIDSLFDTGEGDAIRIAEGDPAASDRGFDDGAAVRVAQDGGAVPGGVDSVGVTPAALPPATLLNGLPGATNFTPVNDDGDRTAGAPPRYFDVTLSATGTTTLDTAVVIDRLTLAGAGAGLDITATGSLTSNIDITHLIGTLNVDGELRTPGDFFMMAGGLSGAGTIHTPFFTNMAGMIAPGTPDGIGTLTFDGNVILASGGVLLINLGPNGTSDRLSVVGHANLGGLVAFGFVPGSTPRFGDTYTFLTAGGGVTGTFQNPGAISAILTPHLTYGADSVTLAIQAGLYADLPTTSAVQGAYAGLLDQNRAQYDRFADVFGPLDLMGVADIQASLDGLTPGAESLKTALGATALDGMGRFYRNRLDSAGRDMGGALEVIGRPIDYASTALDPLSGGARSPVGGDDASVIVPGVLPGGLTGFVAAGYMDGRAAPMNPSLGGGKDEFDGYYIAGGLETAMDDRSLVGVSLSTTDLSGSTAALAQSAEGRLWQGAVYGRYQADSGLTLDGQFSVGRFETETRRLAAIGATLFTLQTDDEATAMAGEIGLGYRFDNPGVTVTPGASLRASRVNYGETSETGGGPALRYKRDNDTAIEGRVGFAMAGTSATFQPWMTADYVHAFTESSAAIGANFVDGLGPDALFPLASDDRNWVELGLGLDAVGERWRVTVAAETTIGRDDIENRTYRAAVALRF